jgi:hypothetical protein
LNKNAIRGRKHAQLNQKTANPPGRPRKEILNLFLGALGVMAVYDFELRA